MRPLRDSIDATPDSRGDHDELAAGREPAPHARSSGALHPTPAS